jgi:hypothetical protein
MPLRKMWGKNLCFFCQAKLCYYLYTNGWNKTKLWYTCILFVRVKVPKRSTSQRMRALGLFPGAVVVRGKDWSYGTQDGNF